MLKPRLHAPGGGEDRDHERLPRRVVRGFTPELATGVWVGFDQPKTILPNGFAADVAVPIWATFMKEATKGAKASWIATPRGLSTASVCRMSGQLANPECEHVDVVNRDGQLERRSMVYTEYFLAGTEPHDYCELHHSRGLLGTIASIFHTGEKPPPHVDDDAGIPAATVGVPPPPPIVAAQAPPPPAAPKKRGFWSKLFGVGKDDNAPRESSDDKKKDPKKK